MKDPSWDYISLAYFFNIVLRARKFWGKQTLLFISCNILTSWCWCWQEYKSHSIYKYNNHFCYVPQMHRFQITSAPKLKSGSRPRLCQGFLWGIATIYSPQVQAVDAEQENWLIKVKTFHHMSICVIWKLDPFHHMKRHLYSQNN